MPVMGRMLLIVSGHGARDSSHRALEPSKEPDGLERTIAPAGGDAVVAVIGAPMMARMALRPQQEAGALQERNGSWGCGHVRLLMNLIRQAPHSAESKTHEGERLPTGFVQRHPEQRDQWRK